MTDDDQTPTGDPTPPIEGLADPQFPDRPDHPDFWRLSAAVQEADRLSETEGFGVAMQVDARSAGYMAGQRWLRAKNQLSNEEIGLEGEEAERDRAVILWLDGMTAGVRFQQLRDGTAPEGGTASIDGNRRQRRGKK